MPKAQGQDSDRLGAGTPRSPGSPPESRSEFGPYLDRPYVQSSTADSITDLVDDFSRVHTQDFENADIMSRQATDTATDLPAGSKGNGRGRGIKVQHSPASNAAASPGGNTDADMSADERQSTGSDATRVGSDQDDGGQSEMIDRIMKSFCSSLDAKIAVIKESKALSVVKREGLEKAESHRQPVASAGTIPKDPATSAPFRKRAMKTKLQGWSQPADAQPEPTAPGSVIPQPSAMASFFTPVLATTQAPAPTSLGFPSTAHGLMVSQSPGPPPPSSPVTFASFRSRQQVPTPSPPPPPPQAPLRFARQASGLAGPPPNVVAPMRNTTQPRTRSHGQEAPAPGTGLGSAASIPSLLARSSREPHVQYEMVESDIPHTQHDPNNAPGSREQAAPGANDSKVYKRRRGPIPDSDMRYRRIRRASRPSTTTLDLPTPSGAVSQGEHSSGVHPEAITIDPSIQPDGQPNWSVSELPGEGVNAEESEEGVSQSSNAYFGSATTNAPIFESNASSIEQEMTLPFIGYTFKNFGSPSFPGQSIPALSNFHHQAPIPSAQRYGLETPEGRQGLQGMKRASGFESLSPGTLPEAPQEEDGDGRRKKAKRAFSSVHAAMAEEKGTGKFACPYFQRNPKKYRKWTSCPGPGWDEVHRVKTHLYRRHALPIQCPRCWETFKMDGQLQLHLQKDPPCFVQRNRTIQEGFTKDQEKKLRSRKKTHADMTDEDKWREIYMIIFPDDNQSAIPSPYYESEDGSENQNLGCSGELEDYATFIRREMPTLVRRELETLFREEFKDVEERVRPRIADIVLNLQPRLLGLYKQSQIPLNEYGPQQHTDAASGSEPTLTPLLSQGTGSATGSGPDLTPDTAFGVEDVFTGAETQLGFYSSGLDEHWGAMYPVNPMQLQPPETNTGLGLNWESEFDKLLNPAFFMPPTGELPAGYLPQTGTRSG